MTMNVYYVPVTWAQTEAHSDAPVVRTTVLEVLAREVEEAAEVASEYIVKHKNTMCLVSSGGEGHSLSSIPCAFVSHVLFAREYEADNNVPRAIESEGYLPYCHGPHAPRFKNQHRFAVQVDPETTWDMVRDDLVGQLIRADVSLDEVAAKELADDAIEQDGTPEHKEDDTYPFYGETFRFDDDRYKLVDVGRDEYIIVDFDGRTVDDCYVSYREALELVDASPMYLFYLYTPGISPCVVGGVESNVTMA